MEHYLKENYFNKIHVSTREILRIHKSSGNNGRIGSTIYVNMCYVLDIGSFHVIKIWIVNLLSPKYFKVKR
jgi:hypothetical protein